MRSIFNKVFLAATAVIALMLPLTSATGNAAVQTAPSAANYRTQYLVADPRGGMPTSVVTRRIYLAAGTYVWHAIPQTVCRRDLHLGEGWYLWIDHLEPRDGYYNHFAYLDPDNPAWGTAVLRCEWHPNNDTTYPWGSALVPQF
jgi:hypothetical protein